MRKFTKKPELAFIVIPGIGRVADNRILEGDNLAKFAPSLLVEVLPNEKAAPPAVIVPPPPPEPVKPIISAPEPEGTLTEVLPDEAKPLVETEPAPAPDPDSTPPASAAREEKAKSKPAPAPRKGGRK